MEPHYGLSTVTAATAWPIEPDEARAHCRIDITDEDAQVYDWIKAATEYAEREHDITIMSTTLRMTLDGWPCATDVNRWGSILLPRWPVTSVSSIAYVDGNGTTQTWASSNYTVDIYSKPARISKAYGITWPTLQEVPNSVTVQFVAGYSSAAAVPATLKRALYLLVGHFSENREATSVDVNKEIEFSVSSLLGKSSWGSAV